MDPLRSSVHKVMILSQFVSVKHLCTDSSSSESRSRWDESRHPSLPILQVAIFCVCTLCSFGILIEEDRDE